MPRYGDFDALKEAVYNSKIRLPHDLMAIVKLIDNAPAADVEPVVHASWVNAEEKPYIRKHFHKKVCSNCFREGQERWKRCPYCEAKMDGKD